MYQPEGNYFDKYNSKGFFVRKIMNGFFESYAALLAQTLDIKTVLEAGCGEGEVTRFIYKMIKPERMVAFDISEKVISEAEERALNDGLTGKIDFHIGSIYEIDDLNNDLVVCSEVLEHMDNPEKALEELKKASGGNGYILVSVPREPIWRILNMARGKYIGNLGNTPGHVNHWSKRSFLAFLKNGGIEIVDVCSPLPWTVVLGKVNR